MVELWEKIAEHCFLPICPFEMQQKIALELQELLAARKDINATPTEAQKESGNYAKGHINFHGLAIALENAKGATRSGTDKDGKQWKTIMKCDYGYFKGTTGKDKDHVDVFIGPELDSELVFIVNQVVGGKFDEHKVILGTKNEEQARELYLLNYEKGWPGLSSIVAMTLPKFKNWILDSTLTKKPAKEN